MLVDSTKDGAPLNGRLPIKLIARLAFSTDWFILSICALFRFPHQFWTDDELRWIFIGAMLCDSCWAVPTTLARLEENLDVPLTRAIRILAPIRTPWLILTLCAFGELPSQFWVEFRPLRSFLIGTAVADFWWTGPKTLAYFKGDPDGPPLLRRITLSATIRTLWAVLLTCALWEFPSDLWIEYYPLRWLVFGTVVGYGWWILPRGPLIVAGFWILRVTLTICALFGLPPQLWVGYDPMRWLVIGAVVGDSWSIVARSTAGIEEDGPPSYRILLRIILAAMLRIDWCILATCALFGRPRHLWIEYDSLRWIVLGVMLANLSSAAPQFVAQFRKDRETARWKSWVEYLDYKAQLKKDRAASR